MGAQGSGPHPPWTHQRDSLGAVVGRRGRVAAPGEDGAQRAEAERLGRRRETVGQRVPVVEAHAAARAVRARRARVALLVALRVQVLPGLARERCNKERSV